ncbi:hypothetical protein LG047_01740 [Methylocystis sp. WRRC1]|uniref:hypothetical protein n=1 Tax=Methylocystis sp. WRRC1 TaxID=1732014 RepID=UPI001D15CBF8|nr:hypothetical protein [Methylocystis sp. WRRC1]MCC3244051.1 hypothetical protein [Methylocystis sp. WRRC1]
MTRKKLAVAILAITAALAARAEAAQLQGCYVRVYDADHLAKNPRQIIRRIQFERMEGDYDPPQYGVRVHLKSDKRPWDAGGPCKPEGASLRCDLDGDSGHVRATPDGDKLRLEVIDYIGFEADAKNGDLDRKSFSDAAHKTFILSHEKPKACK